MVRRGTRIAVLALLCALLAGVAVGRALPVASANAVSRAAPTTAPSPSGGTAAAPAVTLAPASATPAPRRRVVLVGDSLIYGGPLPDDQGLPADIARDRPDLDVLNLALGGDTAQGVLGRIHEVIDARPDEMVLWIGTNDALAGVPVTDYAARVQQIITTVGAAHTVLVSPIQDYSQPQAYLPYAQALLALAARDHLDVLDLHLERADFLADGAHLIATSLARVGKELEPKL
jgi:lysophospholipase L1-like esterase